MHTVRTNHPETPTRGNSSPGTRKEEREVSDTEEDLICAVPPWSRAPLGRTRGEDPDLWVLQPRFRGNHRRHLG